MSALSISPEYDARPTLRVVETPTRNRQTSIRVPEEVAQRPSRRAVAAPARLTRRGRAVLVLLFLTIALGLMIPFGGWATATLTGGSPEPVRVVEVQPGQTLYDIAGQVAKPGHIREMVYRIEELNSLPSATISEGQKLAIPKG
jgi:hypothetical protein